MSSEHEPPKERARPKTLDALSLFLGAAMLLLVLMYALDHLDQTHIETHATRAAKLPLGELSGPCAALSSGLKGDQALILCRDMPAPQVKLALQALWQATPPEAWLASVAIRDAHTTLVCDRALSQCATHALPSSTALKASRRRPAR